MKITGCDVADWRGRTLIGLSTDQGVHGSAIVERAPSERLSTLVRDLLIDADPRANVHHWSRLSAANERHDRALSLEIAALDIALWDLRARLNGEPLWRTLGGVRPKANTHTRLPGAVKAGARLHAWWEGMRRQGVRGVVVEASDDAEADASTFVTLRGLLGDGMDRALMLDANERWHAKDAIHAIKTLERSIDLSWIESPVHRGDFLGMKRAADAIRGAVCSGGRLTSAADFLPHLQHRSMNVVQIDVARVGITAALQIADAAYAFELPIALTASAGNLHAHLASVLPYCASVELSADTTIESSIRVENGWAIAGDAPGHGLSFGDASSGAVRS